MNMPIIPATKFSFWVLFPDYMEMNDFDAQSGFSYFL